MQTKQRKMQLPEKVDLDKQVYFGYTYTQINID